MGKRITAPLICAFLNGCMFIGLNEDVKKLEAAVSISGKIEHAGEATRPVVVTLSRLFSTAADS